MNKTLSRIIGITLIVAAIGGFIFSVFGIYAVWAYKPRVTENLLNALELTSNTLEATAQGLELTRSSLEIATSSLNALQSTVETTAETFDLTSPMLDTIISLSEEDLPNSIIAIQGALESAQASAELIDNVLSALTIFNRSLYNPETPLHVTLQQVSDSLDNLPDAFSVMVTSLDDAKDNLQTIQDEINQIASDIQEINTSLQEFDAVVNQYQELVEDLQVKIANLETNLPTYLTIAAVILTIFLLWMVVVQFGLVTQGMDLLQIKSSQPIEEETVGIISDEEEEAIIEDRTDEQRG